MSSSSHLATPPSSPRGRAMRLARGLAVVLLLAFALGAALWLGRYEIQRWRQGLPAFTHSLGAEQFVRVPMPDGVELSTHVQLPEGEGPWPGILIRNPYERFDMVARGWCGLLVRYGYGCVYQDVRGQMESGGEWSPLIHEPVDGRATLEWLRTQAWLDGNIGLFGPSYLAAVQWAAASEGFPPEVKTFVPTVMATDLRRVLYENGMFRHETFTAWAALNPSRGTRTENGPGYQKALRHRPHTEADARYFGQPVDWYQQWIRSERSSEPLWQQEAFEKLLGTPARTQVPVLMIGGWYDVFLGPQLDDFEHLASRDRSRLVIGPWTHVGQSSEEIEAPDSEGGLAQWHIVLDWLGQHLKGEPGRWGPGTSVYAIGAGRWIERDAWPPPTRPERRYLDDLEAARDCAGGSLSPEPALIAQQVAYDYDPDDPVPTRGGAGMLAFILPGFEGAPPANVSQAGLCDRDDVLTFMTEPLSEPRHIAGSIAVSLSVRSDAPDTAFTARLIEVYEDGRSLNVRDGIMRLTHRNGSDEWAVYEPGERVTLHFETWPIEWVTRPGSRLRLDISSSDFPKYHAHTNRAGRWAEQEAADVAHQTILSEPGRESWVEWPLIEGDEEAQSMP